MQATQPKKAISSERKSRRLPPVVDYSDIVSDEHLERIKALVPEAEYEGAEVVSGPAW